jgi:hypothetical protein
MTMRRGDKACGCNVRQHPWKEYVYLLTAKQSKANNEKREGGKGEKKI